jgi:transcription initiation factor TFIIA small subunit
MVEEGRIEPQLAMKVVACFDRIVTEVLADKVKARLSFKVIIPCTRFMGGSLWEVVLTVWFA